MSTEGPSSFVNSFGVLSQSKRIINAHSRHFLALSVLFILPLSFSITVYPTLHRTFTSPQPNRVKTLVRLAKTENSSFPLPIIPHRLHHELSINSLIFFLVFAVIALLLLLCAVGSITYSVFHGFYGRPVKLVSAIKSLSHSFMRLLVTVLAALLLVSVGLVTFGLYVYLGMKVLELLEVEISPKSSYFMGFVILGAVILGIELMCLRVKWALSSAIVVVESQWGFEPIKRSSTLIPGAKLVFFSLDLFFGTVYVVLLWFSLASEGGDFESALDDGWKSWAYFAQIVATSAILTVLLLHHIAATTVLYMYCKALHGELAWEIAKEFANDYVSLPFDDEKVPHVVSVVHP